MSDAPDSARDFILLGNLPCIDLVNTRPLRHGRPEELLRTFADLVAWLEAAGLITAARGGTARRRWDGTPEGRKVLRTAVEFREELRTMIERLSSAESPGTTAVRLVNQLLASRPQYSAVVGHDRDWRTEQRSTSDQAVHLLVPVAESAAWLITQGEPRQLRKCEDPACVLYFYDTTKNKTRRWCSMDGCGARAKAAAYYRRERKRPR